MRTDYYDRFVPAVLAHKGSEFLTGDMLAKFTLTTEGPLSVIWSPTEYRPPNARLVLVGITPGRVQAEKAFQAFREALRAKQALEAAAMRAKLTASFSGPMRRNLVTMLDYIGLHTKLGVTSCADLFDCAHELVHFTSALRYPVLLNGRNYNGFPDMLLTPALRHWVETTLAEEAQALPRASWLPLGPKPAAALRHLAEMGSLDPMRILEGLPHPSGANAERISFFLGRKPRDALSWQTDPEKLEQARMRLMRQVTEMTPVPRTGA